MVSGHPPKGASGAVLNLYTMSPLGDASLRETLLAGPGAPFAKGKRTAGQECRMPKSVKRAEGAKSDKTAPFALSCSFSLFPAPSCSSYPGGRTVSRSREHETGYTPPYCTLLYTLYTPVHTSTILCPVPCFREHGTASEHPRREGLSGAFPRCSDTWKRGFREPLSTVRTP